MKIILSAVEPSLSEAWETFCGHLENVTVHQGSILDLEVDAVVSPANSFGFMDGGIDHLYSRAFGWHVQDRLQKLIRDRHHGEFLVGRAEIIETDHPRIPYLIAAPTMRVPMILRDSVNPYLAARAALLLVKHGTFSSGTLAGDPVASTVQSVGESVWHLVSKYSSRSWSIFLALGSVRSWRIRLWSIRRDNMLI